MSSLQNPSQNWSRGLGGASLYDFAQALVRLIFPPQCLICGTPVENRASLCPDCWKEVHFLDGPVCAVCGLPFDVDPGAAAVCGACLAHPPAFAMARAVLRYDDASKAPILALKHADRLDLAPMLAHWMLRSGQDLIDTADMIVPVPLHPMRLWRRRYNQAAELARFIARQSGRIYAPLLLQRRRATKSQGEMPSAKARRRNVRGAFVVPVVHRAAVQGRHILLIDDVLTTGATVDACARALKWAGAEKVSVLAVARVVRTPEGII